MTQIELSCEFGNFELIFPLPDNDAREELEDLEEGEQYQALDKLGKNKLENMKWVRALMINMRGARPGRGVSSF